MMDLKALLKKLETVTAIIGEIEAELNTKARPFRLAFVNFFAGGKSYAYTATEDIKEGDIVIVPTASRGDIPGVVVYTHSYAEDELPFHDTKTVAGKLENMNYNPLEMLRMMTELAPAIADREASKGRLLAFLARRAAAATPATEEDDTDTDIPFPEVEKEPGNTENKSGLYEGETMEGDIPVEDGSEPETTVSHAAPPQWPF